MCNVPMFILKYMYVTHAAESHTFPCAHPAIGFS